MRTRASTTTLENVDVECTACGVRMTSHLGSSASVRYFQCPGCHRWVSSMYQEVFRADARVRTRKPEERSAPAFEQVKDRLERWLSALDDQDPYRLLGVSPMDAPNVIREKYREMALANHPDRGGSVERMRQINDAYQRIELHREKRRREALSEGLRAPELQPGV